MEALIVIAACLVLAMALRVLDVLTSRSRIRSVGANANDKSKEISQINFDDPESIAEGIAHYSDLDD